MTFFFPNKPRRIFSVEPLQSTIDFEQWLVQPKWNGHRALPHCDPKGRITVYSRYGQPLKLAASNWNWLAMLDLPRPWLLDAELMRDGRMIAWDFAVLGGNVRFKESYQTRLTELQSMLKKVSKDKYSVECIETLPARKYRNFMLRAGEPELEGFVFKLQEAVDMWGPFSTSETASQFKYRF